MSLITLPLKDRTNPRSLINIVPSVVQTAIAMVPDELFERSDEQLKKHLKSESFHDVLDILRTSWWVDYSRAQAQGVSMEMSAVISHAGVNREFFFKRIITNSHAMAFILKPPPDYAVLLKSLLDVGLQRLREIINLPLYRPEWIGSRDTGEVMMVPDPKMAHVIAQVVKDVDMRVHGAIPQFHKIETRSMNMNINHNASSTAQPPKDLKDIDAEIKRLELAQRVAPLVEESPDVDIESEVSSENNSV